MHFLVLGCVIVLGDQGLSTQLRIRTDVCGCQGLKHGYECGAVVLRQAGAGEGDGCKVQGLDSG